MESNFLGSVGLQHFIEDMISVRNTAALRNSKLIHFTLLTIYPLFIDYWKRPTVPINVFLSLGRSEREKVG